MSHTPKRPTDSRLRRIPPGWPSASSVSSTSRNNGVDWNSVPGCDISSAEIEHYRLEKGDLLIARTGGTIGKTFLVDDVPVVAVFASYLIRVQIARKLHDRYIKLFLESTAYWDQLQMGSRGTGQPNVNGQALGNLRIAIPPLAEQHRIVAKVDELMALCDRLEARRRSARPAGTGSRRQPSIASITARTERSFASTPNSSSTTSHA